MLLEQKVNWKQEDKLSAWRSNWMLLACALASATALPWSVPQSQKSSLVPAGWCRLLCTAVDTEVFCYILPAALNYFWCVHVETIFIPV